tara:strand:- start:320 stop:688 length:369 start_codon:yes stop_codon:yes gene_type:complete
MTEITLQVAINKITELESNYANLLLVLQANNIDFDLVSSTSTKKSKSSKKKTSDDPDKPKRPISGYILFSKENRDNAKSRLQVDNGDDYVLKNSDVMVMLGKMWKELGEDDQKTWNVKAKNL